MSNIDTIMKDTEDRMNKSIEAMKKDFSGFRTGKASPAMVESIMVDYYGSQCRLRDMATISTPEPRMLVIQPFDQSAIAQIEKAIKISDLGIMPNVDGRIIRLPVPELSEERRRDMTKLVSSRAEDGKIEIRNARRDANDLIKKAQKASDITEDDSRDMQADVQKMTDKFVELISQLQADKEKDLMTL